MLAGALAALPQHVWRRLSQRRPLFLSPALGRRLALFSLCLLVCIIWTSEGLSVLEGCEDTQPVHWRKVEEALWHAVETRDMSNKKLLEGLLQVTKVGKELGCVVGYATSSMLLLLVTLLKGKDFDHWDLMNPLVVGGLPDLVVSGFPIFGLFSWYLAETLPPQTKASPCRDIRSQEFKAILRHHRQIVGSAVPTAKALEYLLDARKFGCPSGEIAALSVLALNEMSSSDSKTRSLALLEKIEELIWAQDLTSSWLGELHREWQLWDLLHAMTSLHQARRPDQDADTEADGQSLVNCLIMMYVYPTEEIERDTKEFLEVLRKLYYEPLNVKHPVIVFTDENTSETLVDRLQPLFPAPIVPAVIPEGDLTREMPSYSCTEGVKCASGVEFDSLVHRGVVNQTQYWSPTYLRVSRYSAGPMFLHPALDRCGSFLKLDTDFYLTQTLKRDPLDEIRREGTRLSYWQLQLQGQRQMGYTQVSLGYLERRQLTIRNPPFNARGRFLERAQSLGMDLEGEVPEAYDAATVIYGCAFGGDVQFFREPTYQDFFRYMDLAQGFEQAGWSNQFFLGTAAAAFLDPSQTRRLYISGRHQESEIWVENGNITERLTGSSKGLLR